MKIPFHRPHITNKEFESIKDSLLSGWLTMGPKTIEFEEAFKQHIGSDYAISLNSATAAILFEGWANTAEQAHEMLLSGEVIFKP